MMSLAIYSKIDPSQPAAFSSTIVTGLLRGDLHFAGVVISDDLGATEQVAGYAVGDRAVRLHRRRRRHDPDRRRRIRSPAMAAAVLARARADPAFAAQVDAAALRVLEAKQARSLLGCNRTRLRDRSPIRLLDDFAPYWWVLLLIYGVLALGRLAACSAH